MIAGLRVCPAVLRLIVPRRWLGGKGAPRGDGPDRLQGTGVVSDVDVAAQFRYGGPFTLLMENSLHGFRHLLAHDEHQQTPRKCTPGQ